MAAIVSAIVLVAWPSDRGPIAAIQRALHIRPSAKSAAAGAEGKYQHPVIKHGVRMLPIVMIMIAISVVILLAWLRQQYANTIRIAGSSLGWRVALADTYYPLSPLLNFTNLYEAHAIALWCERGPWPTPSDVKRIQDYFEGNPTATADEIFMCLRCNASFTSGGGCQCSNPASAPTSSKTSTFDTVWKYAMPVAMIAAPFIGDALKALLFV